MTNPATIRRGQPDDAAACAAVKNAWIDETDWMPRVHPHDDVARHYRDYVFARREVWVAGTPPVGFIALDVDASADAVEVTSLFVAKPGRGVGRALLDVAKKGRSALELWTFVANQGARRFYAREGFSEVHKTEGENEEGLPDVLMRWAQ